MTHRRYWLLKSEPSCFSFDDLWGRPDRTEHWDGVRNFQARNLLRDQMQVGDLGFFYYSSIPEPAIVGIVEVVKAGYPDWTALNPESEYFDPRSSQDNPIWFMVDVRAVTRLPRPVTLQEVKAWPSLAGMVLLSRSRLSVQPVMEEEWQLILQVSGVDLKCFGF